MTIYTDYSDPKKIDYRGNPEDCDCGQYCYADCPYCSTIAENETCPSLDL